MKNMVLWSELPTMKSLVQSEWHPMPSKRLWWALTNKDPLRASPEAIHQIYRYSNALDKAPFYGPYNTTGFSKHGDVFSKSNDKYHGQRRRIVNNVYSMSNVSKGEQYVDICSKLFIERLGEYADQSTACDFGEWIHW